MRLIYLSPVPWDSFAQRPHKFADWFFERTQGEVLWVDPYATRLPNLSDLRHSRPPASNTKRPPVSWLRVLKPLSPPIEPLPGSSWVNGLFWQRHLRQIERFAGESKSFLVIGKPSALAIKVLDLLPDCSSLYDAMDDFPSFYKGISRISLARKESDIARRVDVIWASSSELKLRWGRIHKEVRLVRNGLDPASITSFKRPGNSAARKIFGYVGTIAKWFDWEWVCALATSRPSDEIRLIGPMIEPPEMALPKNIVLLPACDHPTALEHMTHFDVGLIPFKRTTLTASVDPIKYYEYRAVGLPVISTNFGEMGFHAGEGGVFITNNQQEIPNAVSTALMYEMDADEALEFARGNSWKERFDFTRFIF